MVARVLKSPLLWLMALSAAAYSTLIVPQWSRLPVWDSAYYVCLARSLAHGGGYTFMGWPHGKYPPGLPLLLAPIELACGDNFLLMHALMAGCGLSVILMTWLLMRRLASPPPALAVSVLTAASYGLFQESSAILSDVPYTFISLAALYFAERLLTRFTRRGLGAVIALMLAAYLTRVIGFTLAPAIALAVLLDPRGRPFSRRLACAGWIVGAMGLVMAAWMGYGAWSFRQIPADLRPAVSYEREFLAANPSNPGPGQAGLVELGRRVRNNFGYYRVMLVDLMTAKLVTRPSVRWALTALWLAGWLIVLTRRRSAAEFYSFLFLCVLLLWPTPQGKRFLVPLLPLIYYYPLAALSLIDEWASKAATKLHWSRNSSDGEDLVAQPPPAVSSGPDAQGPSQPGAAVPQSSQAFGCNRQHSARSICPLARWSLLGALVAALFVGNAQQIIPFVRAEHATPYYAPETAEFIQALDWVRAHTPANAMLITDRAPMAYALTGRVALSPPWVPDQAEVLDFMRRHGATHVLANRLGFAPQYLLPVIRAHPERFREIQRFGEDVIYEFVKPTQ